MTVDSANGNVSWTPESAGNFSVVLRVADDKGAEALQGFSITVSNKIKAKVEILTPSDSQKIKGKTTITGTATKGSLEVVSVQVRTDDGEWYNATGKDNWQYSLDTTKLKNGVHSLQARAYDGMDYSDPVNRTIMVGNQKAAGKGFIPGFTGLLVLLAAVSATFLIMRRRRT